MGALMALIFLTLFCWPISAQASEDIYGLKIENINRNGADFYWSTSIETIGTIEYAYAKLPQLYNPQKPGTSQDILISVIPLLSKSEDHYVKSHHIKIDNLNLGYDPFVQYTIKSKTFNGEVYTLPGELVLVDTKIINWWQTPWFVISFPIFMFILGRIAPWKYFTTIKRKIKLYKFGKTMETK
jgi:hypothetical protein